MKQVLYSTMSYIDHSRIVVDLVCQCGGSCHTQYFIVRHRGYITFSATEANDNLIRISAKPTALNTQHLTTEQRAVVIKGNV